MRELQNMRQERENAEHQRAVELKKMELDAYAGMSVEQIMAINPNISPEAAKALAEKFKGEHLQGQVEMANQQKDEMRSYQGVIAISYTRKASSNLKSRTTSGDIQQKNSFFGTIDESDICI